MKKIREQSVDQERWNQYGIERIKEIEKKPDRYIIRNCPISNLAAYDEIMRLLNPIQGKIILELGCGRGDFSVWIAKQSAKVTAVDIGHDLIAAARTLSRINQVDCEFREGNIIDLPFDSATFDVVIGLAILHHLSETDVSQALRESHRVLKEGGIAIFHESVENSKLFNFIQNLFPAGKKGGRYYRPSIMQRKRWANYIETLDDRCMTNRELVSAGKEHFRVIRIIPYGFLIRFARLIGAKYRNTLLTLDRFLFKVIPPLRYLSQTVLVIYQK